MAKSCLLSLGICLFILFHGCLAVRPYNSHQGQGRSTRPDHQSRGEQSECQINNLDALEPSRRIEAEAGQFEIWDDNNEQFRCAGVAAYRVTIQPKGLSLPVYHNQPRILYIVQGRGVLGLSIPGCPETFQLFQQDEQSEEEDCRSQRSEDEGSSSQRSKDQGGKSQQSEDQDSRRQKSGEQYSRSQQSEDQDSRRHKSESRSQGSKSQQSEHQSSTSRKSEDQHCRSPRSEDFHQQPRFFKEGDILMVPNGVSYWVYNDGDTPLVAIAVIDTRNNFNQLDRKVRNFWLAGNIQEQQEEEQRRGSSSSKSEEVGQESSNNVFSGFDAKILAQAFGVTKETVRKLQRKNDERGPIIQVERGLQVIKSISSEEQERQQETNANGLEETVCNMRLRQNIGKATSSDVYTPFGGRVTNVNSQSLPILGVYELSAERGHLYKNAIMSPHWNVNAHSVMCVLRGEARVQIVGNSGQTAYDGQLCEGQLIVIPQNFAVVKQAGDNGFEWVSIKTSDNAVRSPLVGRTSAIRAMPEEVLVNVYRISNEEARMLKYNREETCVLAPNFESNGRFSVM